MVNTRALARVNALVAALLVVTSVTTAATGVPDAGFESIMKECTKIGQTERGLTNVTWYAPEVMVSGLAQQEMLTPKGVAEVKEAFRPYLLITVSQVGLKSGVELEYASAEEIRKIVRVRDRYGVVYEPIPPGEGGPFAEVYSAMWEKALKPQYGPAGEGTHLFIFNAYDDEGRMIADALEQGYFTVLVGDLEFTWELPLRSLLPPKPCPACGRELSGAFNYCPYDGTELGTQKVITPAEVSE
jgi:hypothetical protein